MSKASVGDLVWVPDKTQVWGSSKALEIEGPTLGLIKGVRPFKILVNVEGTQEELLVHRKDVYDIGDLYD